MHGREEVDGGVRAKEPLVAVPADQQFRGRIAEQLEHESPIDQAAAVVRLLGPDPQPQLDTFLLHRSLPESPLRREISSRRNAATRDAVVPGPKPAS